MQVTHVLDAAQAKAIRERMQTRLDMRMDCKNEPSATPIKIFFSLLKAGKRKLKAN